MFTEDLTEFFDVTDGFAVTATFGASSSVNGIFGNDYVEVEGVNSSVPVFICATADVAALAVGSTITIQGTVYTVRIKKPDETGSVSELVLEQVG